MGFEIQSSSLPMKAAILLTDGFEEMEAVAPIDVLRRAGVQVSVIAVGSDLVVTGRNGIVLKAEELFKSGIFSTHQYDVIIVPGGPGHVALKDNSEVLKALKTQSEEQKWIAAICAAPLVLQSAGLLDAQPAITGHTSIQQSLPWIQEQEAVVVDHSHCLITSRGAGTATSFALTIIEVLMSKEKSNEVAQSMCCMPLSLS
jgi:protein deglycase